jgi:GT2 family glycosyltransferase
MDKLTFAPPIVVPSEFNAAVDLVIAYHGQYEKLTILLESIFRLTRSNYYKICIVDDASPNSDFIRTIEKNSNKNASRRKSDNIIQTIRLDEQRGFAGALKVGFEATENPYVCFLHSDCKIEDVNWLRSLGECLLSLKPQDVRMVSPVTNNSTGGHPAQTGDKFIRSKDHVILGKEDFLSMYCFLCHRELFKRCGGFLKEYPYGGFEDEEFAYRMQHHGFKQAVCKDSWIHHEGQATIRSVWRTNPDIKDIMEIENRERCIVDMKKLK